jgi:very-short-patch-repair endonuclease
MTAAKTVLWMHLKAGINGYQFRRQHPVGLYIADFYCHKAKLVIEVDGNIHRIDEVKKNDKEKVSYLIYNGYLVLRFTNKEVMTQAEIVLEKIGKIIHENITSSNLNESDENRKQ